MELPPNLDFDALPGALVVYDQEGQIVRVNAAALEILGTSRDELLGTPAAEAGWLIADPPALSEPESIHPVTAVLRTGQPQRGVLARILRGDRRQAWVRADAVPMTSSGGSVGYVMVSLADVTRILLERRSRYSSHGAEDAVRAVTDVLASTRLDPRSILVSVTSTLSGLRQGLWLAAVLKKDPREIVMVAASKSDPKIGQYIDDLYVSGRIPVAPLSTRVIESGEALLRPSLRYQDVLDMLSADARSYIDINPPPFAEPVDCLGVPVVPMRARGAVVGSIGLYERCGTVPLDDDDVRWLQEIADRVGEAVDNAQLYVDAVSRLERLAALRSVGLAISGSPDLRLTLQVVLDRAMSGLAVDAADILLIDETDGMLRQVASAGFKSTAIPDYRLSVDEILPGRPTRTRRIETVTALGAFSQFRRRSLFAREGFKVYGAVPLVARGHMAGVLEVFHRSSLEPDQEWFEFLDAIGSEAAIAIETASVQGRLDTPVGDLQAQGKAPRHQLSRRDMEILRYVVEGLSNQEIAELVHLSQSAIKYHVGQLLERIGAANRTELARKATLEGWL